MTNGTTCPEESLLSRFLDRELTAAAEEEISRHLATCPECHARTGCMGRAEDRARTQLAALRRRPSFPAPSSHCPSPEKIITYMQGLLAAEEDRQIEQHLHACDACLHEAKEASRVLSFLSSPQETPPPAALREQVATSWGNSSAKDSLQLLPRLVLQLAERGLRLIESYLVPPLLEVQEVLIPLAAHRSEDGPSALSLRVNAGESEIAVLAMPEQDGVVVTLTLVGAARKPLADHRIFLRQQGRAIFSAQTDEHGRLEVPRLEPGTYEVACDEIHTTFVLEVRP